MSHRILIADDHPLMRTALTQTIGQAIPGAVILEASRFDHIKPLLDTGEPPDIILLDLHMPGMSGLIGLMMLRSEYPAIPVIVNSAAPAIRNTIATCQKTRHPGSQRKKAGSVHANAAGSVRPRLGPRRW